MWRHVTTMAAMEAQLLRPAAAAARYSISTRTLARLAKTDPAFPRPVKAGPRMVLHRVAALDAYFQTTQTDQESQP